uniref:Secreted protein n=1 Tax=Cacopsylla melanoneura TaxID=428564 RepID=A0A8D8PX37_9HEMI
MMNMKLYYVTVLCGFYLFETTSAAAYRRLAALEPDHVAAAEDSKDVDTTTPAAGDGLVPSNPLTSMISNVLEALGTQTRGAVSSVDSGVGGSQIDPIAGMFFFISL